MAGYLLVGALLLGLSWVAYDRFAADRVRVTPLGYDVQSDSRVVVRFRVQKDDGATGRCRVVARDRLGKVVGDELVVVGAGQAEVSRPLATSGRAATGEVTGCEPAPQPSSP